MYWADNGVTYTVDDYTIVVEDARVDEFGNYEFEAYVDHVILPSATFTCTIEPWVVVDKDAEQMKINIIYNLVGAYRNIIESENEN